MSVKSIARLAISLIVPQAAGAIGALVTAPAISAWYAKLDKPALRPPGWVFGPVWTILYILMGIAVFLVWQKSAALPVKRIAIGFFSVQLLLNIAWSYIFFGLKDPGLALVEIVVLLAAIVATVVYFFRISRPAGLLLVPYAVWVTFATFLNYAIWQLN